MYTIPIENAKYYKSYLTGLSCIYIYSKSTQVLYVGQTQCAFLRHNTHKSNSKSNDPYKRHESKIYKESTHYTVIPTDTSLLNEREVYFINKYQPLLNRTHNNYHTDKAKFELFPNIPEQYFEIQTRRYKYPSNVGAANLFFYEVRNRRDVEKVYTDAIFCITVNWSMEMWRQFHKEHGYPIFTQDLPTGELRRHYFERLTAMEEISVSL